MKHYKVKLYPHTKQRAREIEKQFEENRKNAIAVIKSFLSREK